MSEALVAADMVPLVPVVDRTTAPVVPVEGWTAVSPVAVAAPAAEVGSRR